MLKNVVLGVGILVFVTRIVFPPMVLVMSEGRKMPCPNNVNVCVADTGTVFLHLIVIAAVTAVVYFMVRGRSEDKTAVGT